MAKFTVEGPRGRVKYSGMFASNKLLTAMRNVLASGDDVVDARSTTAIGFAPNPAPVESEEEDDATTAM